MSSRIEYGSHSLPLAVAQLEETYDSRSLSKRVIPIKSIQRNSLGLSRQGLLKKMKRLGHSHELRTFVEMVHCLINNSLPTYLMMIENDVKRRS